MAPAGELYVDELMNAGSITNENIMVLNGDAQNAGGAFHTNSGRIVNDQLFRIERNAELDSSGGVIRNNRRFVVDGWLQIGPSGEEAGFFNGPGGELVNNGRIYASEQIIIFGGGRVSGHGTFDSSSVSFGEIEFDPVIGAIEPWFPPNIDPGSSPGTLAFTGDLVLTDQATITMEFTENDGGDRLIVGGQLHANGAAMKLVFLGDGTPGLDQVFDFLETPGGIPAGLALEIPAEKRLDMFDRGLSAAGDAIVGASFASPGATRLEASELAGDFLFNNPGVQRYVEDAIVRPDAFVQNEGTLGVRNLDGSRLEVSIFMNGAGGELLNSSDMTLLSLQNRGVFKHRAGATLNLVGGGVLNNDGGLIDIRGNVSGGYFRQQGEPAVTLVNGVLQVQEVVIDAGTLTGSGLIASSVHMGAGSVLAPGNSPGTLTIDGSLNLAGAEALIEIASDDVYDRVVVSGDATLDGVLRFILLDGYIPAADRTWQWLEVGGFLSAQAIFWSVETVDTFGASYVLADSNGTYDPYWGVTRSGGLPLSIRSTDFYRGRGTAAECMDAVTAGSGAAASDENDQAFSSGKRLDRRRHRAVASTAAREYGSHARQQQYKRRRNRHRARQRIVEAAQPFEGDVLRVFGGEVQIRGIAVLRFPRASVQHQCRTPGSGLNAGICPQVVIDSQGAPHFRGELSGNGLEAFQFALDVVVVGEQAGESGDPRFSAAHGEPDPASPLAGDIEQDVERDEGTVRERRRRDVELVIDGNQANRGDPGCRVAAAGASQMDLCGGVQRPWQRLGKRRAGMQIVRYARSIGRGEVRVTQTRRRQDAVHVAGNQWRAGHDVHIAARIPRAA